MLKGLLHQLFVQLVKHVSAVIAGEGAYSVHFAVDSQHQTLSFRFWESKQFVCTPIVHCGRDLSPTKGYNDLMSRLLSAVSNHSAIICCGVSSADFVNVVDKNPGRKAGCKYPFSLPFARLLQKPSFSVLGRIDICPMLRAPLFWLNGLLDKLWVQSTQYLRSTSNGNSFLLLPWEYEFREIFCAL